MPSPNYQHGMSGNVTAAVSFGGGGFPAQCSTFEYNGSTWSTGGNLSLGRGYPSSTGDSGAGLAAGGSTPSSVSCTEEYNQTCSIGVKTIG